MKHENIRRVDLLEKIEHRDVQAASRRPFREPGRWTGEGFYVRAGALALYRYNARNSGRLIVALYFAGDLVQPRSGEFGIEPIVDSTVAVIGNFEGQRFPPDRLLELARRDAVIAREWLAIASNDCLARTAHLLCEVGVRTGAAPAGMGFQLTQQLIADITSQTSVNVNRVLRELAHLGLIERDGRAITFPDWEVICRYASFRPGYLTDWGAN